MGTLAAQYHAPEVAGPIKGVQMNALTQFLDRQGYGARARLARMIGASPVEICMWVSGRRQIPAHRAVEIEFGTHGEVRVEDLAPDLVWVRVPHDDWPWAGKPLVDVFMSRCAR